MDSLLRMILLALSFCGWLFWVSDRVRVELAAGVVVTGIGSLMFVAGILNVLQETAWVIFACGLYCLFLVIRKRTNIKRFLTPGIIFLCFLSVSFLFLLYQSRFIHYDNFSHWGVAAKVVCESDYFPNIAHTNITFQSYPLGSTCFVYYITEIIGIYPEWLQMWAQSFLMSALVISIFPFCRNWMQYIGTMIGILVLLCSNTGFTELLVDTLLPITGFAALAFCVYYRENITDKMYYVLSYAVFLVCIKNSGLLFAIFLMLYAFMCMVKTKAHLLLWLKIAAGPMIVMFFWNKHVKQCFQQGELAKHSMTMSNFSSVFSDKTESEIYTTFNLFLEKCFSFSNHFVLLLVLALGIWLLSYCCEKENHKRIRSIILFGVTSYVVYQVGMLGMYLLSMPGLEATNLSGYNRYHQTILIYVAAILLMASMMMTSDKNFISKKWLTGGSCVLTVSLLLVATSPMWEYYQKQDIKESERVHYDQLIEDYGISSGLKYLVLVSEARNDSGYLHFMTNYLLSPQELDIVSVSEIKHEDIHNYDYVIMFEETDAGVSFMKDISDIDVPVVCLNPAYM